MRAKLSIGSQYYYEMKVEDAVLEFIKNGIYASELSDGALNKTSVLRSFLHINIDFNLVFC